MPVAVYACRGCDAPPVVKKWRRRCPNCGAPWNPVVRRASEGEFPGGERVAVEDGELIAMSDAAADAKEPPRLMVGKPFEAFDTVLGGGLVEGSVVVLSGIGGGGKSTLLLQVLRLLARRHRIVYVSTEESVQKVALRAKRIGRFNKKLQVTHETELDNVLDLLRDASPEIAVIDSVSMLVCHNPVNEEELLPGSPTAIRVATKAIYDFAQKEEMSFFLISHVTKDGTLAGPSAFRHGVDALLHFNYMPGNAALRELRPDGKNRHGSTGPEVVARFKMGDRGLEPIDVEKEGG